MYVKFCSGPTPRYAPPGRVRALSAGITDWIVRLVGQKVVERESAVRFRKVGDERPEFGVAESLGKGFGRGGDGRGAKRDDRRRGTRRPGAPRATQAAVDQFPSP